MGRQTNPMPTTLLIIDPQCDFHGDSEGNKEGAGSLAVPGADADAGRIAKLITEHESEIEDIVITLDTHNKLHIAHGAFWKQGPAEEGAAGEGDKSPDPFTIIHKEDVEQGKWVPRDENNTPYVLDYIDKLEASGKFKMCIWPEHCIIGSPNHAVTKPIWEATQSWSKFKRKNITYVHKGQNNLTEMYSALSAEVPLEDDVGTQYNLELQKQLLPAEQGERLLVCGQALSHCVNYTVRDLVQRGTMAAMLADPSKKQDAENILKRVHLLRDGASSVGGFEESGEAFVEDMRSLGVSIQQEMAEFVWTE